MKPENLLVCLWLRFVSTASQNAGVELKHETSSISFQSIRGRLSFGDTAPANTEYTTSYSDTREITTDNITFHIEDDNSDVTSQYNGTDDVTTEQHAVITSMYDIIWRRDESEIEKLCFVLYLALASIYIYLGNGMVIVLGVKYRQFHHPGFYTKCAYATLDILLNSSANLTFMVMVYHPEKVPLWWCQGYSILTITFFFATMYMTAYIALERYFFFCHPFKYIRLFTLKSIVICTITTVAIPLSWAITTEFTDGRYPVQSILLCQLDNAHKQTVMQVFVFFLPAICCTVFSATMIRRLQTKAQARVEPANQAPASGTNNTQPTTNTKTKKSLQSAFRLIVLVSGAFWGTYIPSWVIRTFILQNYTWQELDARVNVAASILIRVHVLMGSSFSSAINPIVYFATKRDLRVALYRTLGFKKKQFSWEQEMQDTVLQGSNFNKQAVTTIA